MTPETFARSLAQSDDDDSRALGVAIIVRGLTDDDPADPFRMGWPVNAATAERAAHYLGIADPSADLIARALTLAPTVSDAILNRMPR